MTELEVDVLNSDRKGMNGTNSHAGRYLILSEQRPN